MTSPTTSGTKGFTPGPWDSRADHPQNACANVYNADGNEIATCYSCAVDHAERNADGIWPDQPARDANARLIAAAPELYEALEQCSAILAGYARKGIVSEQDAFQIRESGLSITTAAALDNADAALSKANGEQA